MMEFGEVAMILFSCVAVNYLGLVAAIEKVIRRNVPIAGCPKCLSFWMVTAYGFWKIGISEIPLVLATALLAAYLAKWVQLGFVFIDLYFDKFYDKIYATAHPSDDGAQHTADDLSVLPSTQEGSEGGGGGQERSNNL